MATTTTIWALRVKGDFAVHASVYGKVLVGPSVDSQTERRREKKLVVSPTLGCLATYIAH
jgi:hypothetical protein